MADVLLSIEEASKQLQLSKDQVAEMVKKGLLRGFLDQKTYKFRPADVEAFKKKLASGATTLSEGAPKTGAVPGAPGRKDATSKIDLTEVESDSGIEDTDQTSVLAPVESGEPKDKAPDKAVFKFGEKDLDINEEEPPALEEGDQTSLLLPGSGKEEKAKDEPPPAFDFEEKEEKPPAPGAEAGDSVLVADESESSMDILEVAEESSSESASSASRIALSDDVSSGEEIEAAAETPSQLKQKPAAKPRPKASEPTTDKVVADILGPGQEDSDEALETLDVDEVVETKEAVGEATAVKADSTATVRPSDEYETVGLPAAEETKAATGAAETGSVDGAVAAALQEQAGEEEPAAGEEESPAMIPAGWETAQSWPIGNGLLIAATIVLIVGGSLLFCEAFDIHNGLTAKIGAVVQSNQH